MFGFGNIQKQIDKILLDIQNHHQANENRLDNIEKVLVKQEENLKEHMRRSDSLETLVQQNEAKLVPIQRHINRVDGALKLIGLVGILIGIAAGIVKIISLI